MILTELEAMARARPGQNLIVPSERVLALIAVARAAGVHLEMFSRFSISSAPDDYWKETVDTAEALFNSVAALGATP